MHSISIVYSISWLICTSELKPLLDLLETQKKHNNITLYVHRVFPLVQASLPATCLVNHTMSAQMSSFAISYSEDASLAEMDDVAMPFWTISIRWAAIYVHHK